MAELLVLKIKSDGVLRRITLPKHPEPSFSSLDKKIRDLFNLSQYCSFPITYTDSDGDIVSLVDDDDMKDAITFQKLNPLRLNVKVLGELPPPKSSVTGPSAGSQMLESTSETPLNLEVKQALIEEHITPLIQEANQVSMNYKLTSSSQISENKLPCVTSLDKLIADKLRAMCDVNAASLSSSLEPATSTELMPLKEAVSISSKEFGPNSIEVVTEAKEVLDESNLSEPVVLKAAEEHTGLAVVRNDSVAAQHVSVTSDESQATQESVFHVGFRCDSCDVEPIAGPRFNSTVKDDYDLCSACYSKEGVAGEYRKVDRPPQFVRLANGSQPAKRFPAPRPIVTLPGKQQLSLGRASGCGRSSNTRPDVRLDSQFVRDVSIPDGTEFAPGTHFKKVWCLQNNGSVPWPQHTRLVHVGGNLLGAQNFVAVPVPEEGLKPGEEVEASVDLVAPSHVGRFVSHWRLMAPGGRKFGHRVWALIQIAPKSVSQPKVRDAVSEGASSNVPPSSPSLPSKEEEKEKLAFEAESLLPSSPSGPTEVEVMAIPVPEEAVVLDSTEQQEAVAAAEEEKVVTEDVQLVFTVSAPSSPGSPNEEATSVGGFSFVERPLQATPAAAVTYNVNSVDAEEFVAVEASSNVLYNEMMEHLEAMGFGDREMNAELLIKHEMNVDLVVDELVAATQWDPILEELQDMGFNNTVLNRRLIIKNQGSLKHVVKELVQMHRKPRR